MGLAARFHRSGRRSRRLVPRAADPGAAAINPPQSKSQCFMRRPVIGMGVMRIVIVRLALAGLCGAAAGLGIASAPAADLPSDPSTYPALNPTPADVAPDPWAGLSVSAGVSVWGGKGIKGGVGGETDLNYEHVFDNGIMLGAQASTGYMPFLQASPGYTQFAGSAFAGGSAIVGYDFGRVTPYVITGVDFIRPTRFGTGAFNMSDAVNSVFSGPGAVQAVGTFGVGVNYRVTPNFSMGLEAIVHTYPSGGPFAPWP